MTMKLTTVTGLSIFALALAGGLAFGRRPIRARRQR